MLAESLPNLSGLAVLKPIKPGFDQLYPGKSQELMYNSKANNRTHNSHSSITLEWLLKLYGFRGCCGAPRITKQGSSLTISILERIAIRISDLKNRASLGRCPSAVQLMFQLCSNNLLNRPWNPSEPYWDKATPLRSSEALRRLPC